MPGGGRTMPSRRSALAALAAVAVTHTGIARAQRALRLVVPLPAGTSPDVVARAFAEHWRRLHGETVVIENRPGAATLIGAAAVAQAAPDGLTLLWTVNNTFSINPFVYAKLPYSRDDFAPIARVLAVPFVLLTAPAAPWRTLPELIEHARRHPARLTFASPGIGTSPHVVMAYLMSKTGLRLTHVPYKDSYGPDLEAGRIDLAFDASTTAIAQVQAGRLRALAVSSARRLAQLPDVPAVAEQINGFVGESWHGIFAPRATPAAVSDVLAQRARAVIDEPLFRAQLAGWGLRPEGQLRAEFADFLERDARAWQSVIRAHQIRLE